MLVEEIMTRNVIKVDSNETVLEACKRLVKNKVGSLVVMNKDIIVGILTERDVIQSIILINGDPKQKKVRDVMSPNIKTVHALTPVEKAANIMKENKIKKLPVVLNNEIVGIITETDLSHTIHAFSHGIDELTTFYDQSRENIEKMMDDWADILLSLRNFKKIPDEKEEKTIEV